MKQAQRCKRFLVYWHRGANSGLYQYDSLKYAEQVAADFARLDSMYRVTVVDTLSNKWALVKGDEE